MAALKPCPLPTSSLPRPRLALEKAEATAACSCAASSSGFRSSPGSVDSRGPKTPSSGLASASTLARSRSRAFDGLYRRRGCGWSSGEAARALSRHQLGTPARRTARRKNCKTYVAARTRRECAPGGPPSVPAESSRPQSRRQLSPYLRLRQQRVPRSARTPFATRRPTSRCRIDNEVGERKGRKWRKRRDRKG